MLSSLVSLDEPVDFHLPPSLRTLGSLRAASIDPLKKRDDEELSMFVGWSNNYPWD